MRFSLNSSLNWLYIDINSYFATIEQQLDSSIRNKPVAIVPLLSDHTCAIAASYEAKRLGIKTGTIIREAKKLCPDLICIQARQSVHAEFHRRIFQEIDKYLHVDNIFSIDEGACRLTGSLRDKAEVLYIAQVIKDAIKSNVGDYITCSIGIASNRYLAKIASNMQKPDGLTIILPKDLPDILYKLKLTDLPGVGNKLYQRLSKNGILTVEQLSKFDRGQLRTLWGSMWGEKIWYLMRGADFQLEDSKSSCISQSQVLGPELRNKEGARNILLSLVFKAATRLRAKALLTNNVAINLKLQGQGKLSKRLKTPFINDSQSLSSLLLKLFDELTINNDKLVVHQVSIGFNNLRSDTGQLELAIDKNKQKNNKLSLLMDTINAKYGSDFIRIGLLKGSNKTQDCAAFGYIPKAD